MRALVLHAADKGVRLETVYPKPDLGEDEALVRVRRAGICNTDLEIIQGYAHYGGVLGHEFVGSVESCPSNPSWVGTRVVGEINIPCGDCSSCRAGRSNHCSSRTALGIRGHDGVFADYVALPIGNLHRVPQSVSDDQAVFVEPLAAALAVPDQVHIRPTQRVIVLGDGKLGLLVAQVLALTGCHLTVVGRHKEKLKMLASRGIDVFVAEANASAPEILADVVVEATGSPSGFASARRLVRPRGKLVLKSTYHADLAADLTGIVVDEVQMIGSRCGPFAPALRLLAQGLVDVEALIEARFPLDDGVAALAKATTRGSLKVLLEV